MVLDIQYAESESESTFTDTLQTKVSITFTPSSTKKYLILVSAEWEEELADDNQEITILIDGVEKGKEKKAGAPSRWEPFSYMNFVELNNTAHTIAIQYKRLAVKTAKIRRARIIAIDVPEGAVNYGASEGTSTTSTANWTDKVSISVPQGNWLIIASAQLGFLVAHKSVGMRIYNSSNSSEYGFVNGDDYASGDKFQKIIMKKISLSATNTIVLQFKRLVDMNVTITYAHLIAIDLDTFNTYDYDEDESVSSDNVGTYQTKLTQSFAPSGTVDVLTLFSWETKMTSDKCCEAQGRKGTTEEYYSRNYNAVADYTAVCSIKRASLTTQTFDIRYRTDSAGTSVSMRRARILQLELVLKDYGEPDEAEIEKDEIPKGEITEIDTPYGEIEKT